MLSTLTHVSITLGSGRIAGVGWSMIVLSGGIFQYKINLYFWFEKHSINEKYDNSVNLMICFVWSGLTRNIWLNSPNNHTWSGHSVGKLLTDLGASLLRDVCARTRRARRRAARRRVALDELQQRLEHAALRRQEECQRSGRCSALSSIDFCGRRASYVCTCKCIDADSRWQRLGPDAAESCRRVLPVRSAQRLLW